MNFLLGFLCFVSVFFLSDAQQKSRPSLSEFSNEHDFKISSDQIFHASLEVEPSKNIKVAARCSFFWETLPAQANDEFEEEWTIKIHINDFYKTVECHIVPKGETNLVFKAVEASLGTNRAPDGLIFAEMITKDGPLSPKHFVGYQNRFLFKSGTEPQALKEIGLYTNRKKGKMVYPDFVLYKQWKEKQQQNEEL